MNPSSASDPRLWPNRTVRYYIDPSLPNERIGWLNDAIAHWRAKTDNRIRFVKVSNPGPGIVTVRPGSGGCSATIGYYSQHNTVINLGSNCATAVVHEIGHTLGLAHEHTRADRDNHVTIYPENIQDGKEHNFRKNTAPEFLDYHRFDFNSVMIYWSTAFSKNGSPTLLKKDGSNISNRVFLSVGDVATIASMYGGGAITTGSYKLENKEFNRRLKTSENIPNNVVHSKLDDTRAAIKWRISVSGKYLTARNADNGRYLKRSDKGTNVVSSCCINDRSRWEFISVGGGYYKLKNKDTGEFLDADNADNNVKCNSSSSGDDKLWKLIRF